MFLQSIRVIAAVTALVLITGVTTAMPVNEYACHVATESNIDGIVIIQANDVASATAAAGSSKAQTLKGKLSQAIQVNECIQRPKGSFKNWTIQQFYKKLPF